MTDFVDFYEKMTKKVLRGKGDVKMLDFVTIKATSTKKGVVDIYPEFIIKKSNDLMIKGERFYAIWDEEAGLWSREESDVQRLVDQMIYDFAEKYETEDRKALKLLKNFSSKKWTEWKIYSKSLGDNYHELDKRVLFANDKIGKRDYATFKMDYCLGETGDPTPAYDELIGTLYGDEQRRKIEWAIGSIINGDSKDIQKFLVLHGAGGTGKSTVIKIINWLFEGYCGVFSSKSLASANNDFALEPFKNNPLVATDSDGNLSKIEDNTKLNNIISHEALIVNEKHKSLYQMRFISFCIIGTNMPVKITDAKSGIIRRLIDCEPTGNTVSHKRYDELMATIKMQELGAIARKCLDVYESLGKTYYDNYIPSSMISATNDFYNFLSDNFDYFIDHNDGITLTSAWELYKNYCADANIPYPYKKMVFKEELKNYFEDFKDRFNGERSVYIGFRRDKVEFQNSDRYDDPIDLSGIKGAEWLDFKEQKSEFDKMFSKCPAQYAVTTADGREVPGKKWDDVVTTLEDIDTSKVHYVKMPKHIVTIDFDLKDSKGNKSLDKNIKAASKWPPTYAEVSKGGQGIHLEYTYNGDVEELSRDYAPGIEIKVNVGNSSLRRRLSKCNDLPITQISSGLPKAEKKKKMLDTEILKNEKVIRKMVANNLLKKYHSDTKSSVDYIWKILEDAYASGIKYDITDMRNDILVFANNSTNNSQYCTKLVDKMKFKSDDEKGVLDNTVKGGDELPLIFFDIEVAPNVRVVCWKVAGKDHDVVKMINPTVEQIDRLCKNRLIGYNNRQYDNHILYGMLLGYNIQQSFEQSQQIIVHRNNDAKFLQAYNLSYTDIYDFLSAGNKKSLKKWEIELGLPHKEFPLKWDEPVPEDRWEELADYCANDVLATEATFFSKIVQEDWLARCILADITGLTVNDTTNKLTTNLIVGTDPNPQNEFVYTDLSTIYPGYEYSPYGIDLSKYKEGVKIVSGKSLYKGEDPGEGGFVRSKPGQWYNVALLDVESMHPSSAIKLNVFGKYTKNFKMLKEARLSIKHGDYDQARKMFNGKLSKWLDDEDAASGLSTALKTAINSVYGLTSAKFENKLRDPRNIDNIVAKYGALFMMDLKEEVEKRGFDVVHIKTDSIKIPNATPEIIKFVSDFGKKYGFVFDHEATYERMCLIDEAVYIAKYADVKSCEKMYGYAPKDNKKHQNEWTATGTKFQIPYVFKTLFSGEPLEFEDYTVTKSVTTAMYLKYGDVVKFVGKVGNFMPVLEDNKYGLYGGELVRENVDKNGNVKYDSVTGTKKKGGKDGAYLWIESEDVRDLPFKLEYDDYIDKSYFLALVDDAVISIAEFGSVDEFINWQTPYIKKEN